MSVVITTRNRKKDLMECVDSLVESSYQDFEIIIIDDSSSDGTEKLQKKDFNIKNLSIFHSKQQLMMVGARNLGAVKAKGRWVLFVDDDNIVDKNLVKHMWKCCQKNVNFGIIGVPVYFLYDKKKHFAAQKFSLLTGLNRTIIGDNICKGIVESDGAPNIFMTSKEVLQKTNNFDPLLIQTLTDVDFAMKAKKLGYRCGICQEAITYHKVTEQDNLKPRSMGGIFKQKSYCLIRNRILIVKRYGNIVQKIIFLLLFSWVWPLIYSYFAVKYNRRDLVISYWYGFRDGVVYLLTGRLKNSLSKII